jgi:hypothetical protein
MDMRTTPQVEIPGETPESAHLPPAATATATAPAAANHNSTEVEMGGTQDATLRDAQGLELELVEPELERPVKKNARFNFLE